MLNGLEWCKNKKHGPVSISRQTKQIYINLLLIILVNESLIFSQKIFFLVVRQIRICKEDFLGGNQSH